MVSVKRALSSTPSKLLLLLLIMLLVLVSPRPLPSKHLASRHSQRLATTVLAQASRRSQTRVSLPQLSMESKALSLLIIVASSLPLQAVSVVFKHPDHLVSMAQLALLHHHSSTPCLLWLASREWKRQQANYPLLVALDPSQDLEMEAELAPCQDLAAE